MYVARFALPKTVVNFCRAFKDSRCVATNSSKIPGMRLRCEPGGDVMAVILRTSQKEVPQQHAAVHIC